MGEGGWASRGNAGALGGGCDLCTGLPGCPSLSRLCRDLTSGEEAQARRGEVMFLPGKRRGGDLRYLCPHWCV